MKTRVIIFIVAALVAMPGHDDLVAADLGTAFTYQGRLVKNGTPVTSSAPHCDFTFGLFNVPKGGSYQGTGPKPIPGVDVTDGLFTVSIDFGVDAFNGTARWLEITVQCPGDPGPIGLEPRLELKPAPYALRAANGVGGPDVLNVTAEGNVGIGMTNPTRKLDVLGSIHASDGFSVGYTVNVCSPFPGIERYISSDDVLEIYVRDTLNQGTCPPTPLAPAARVLRLEPALPTPNIIGGHVDNTVTPGVAGATIGGGGDAGVPGASANGISAGFGTIGGGRSNVASADGATIGGGVGHRAGGITGLGAQATIAGGLENVASNERSTVGGGEANMATGPWATIGGGELNNAPGDHSTVGGGGQFNNAGGDFSTVGGGRTNAASGLASTVPGGDANIAGGDFSFAAGRQAIVRDAIMAPPIGDQGTFVWADSSPLTFTSTGPNQFLIRAVGGVGINTNAPATDLDVNGDAKMLGFEMPTGAVAGHVLTSNATGVGTWQPPAGGGAGWALTGNAGTVPGTNFLGTTDNQAFQIHVFNDRALRIEPNAISPNIIGGFSGNTVTAGVYGATIAGGGLSGAGNNNRVTDIYGTIGGGQGNQAGDGAGTITDRAATTVGGGLLNRASGSVSTVGGGSNNTASEIASTVGGGANNVASGTSSAVGGGANNVASGVWATVPGGHFNLAGGLYSFAAGRRAKANHTGTFVWADGTDADFASAAGDQFLIRAAGGVGINTNAPAAGKELDVNGDVKLLGFEMPTGAVAGHVLTSNGTGMGTWQPAAGGGAGWGLTGNSGTNPGTNFVGTTDNLALNFRVNNQRAFRLEPNASSPNIIGGSSANTVTAGVYGATIAGGGASSAGDNNRITDVYGTIGGGQGNQTGDGAGTTTDLPWNTVGGGIVNTASGNASTVGGGFQNTASSNVSTVGGGAQNTASGNSSAIGGGSNNVASGVWATVPGGYLNLAGGFYSFAAGRRAKANHIGTFVWADGTDADFASTVGDQFRVRAKGGTQIYSNSTATVGVQLAAGGNAWAALSDRNVKENITTIDPRDVLERLAGVPVTIWNLKSQIPDIHHIGPMAQDFHAAFGVGEVDTHISSSDADGVALAAIQGLYEIVQEKDCEIEELKAKAASVEQLEAKVAALETMVRGLVRSQKDGAR